MGDGHYTGQQGEAKRWAALIERARRRQVREISILGDFFELWIGLPGMEEAWQHAFFEPLRALREHGVYLRYVVGNKDYFVEEWNRRHKIFDVVVNPGCAMASQQGLLYLAHGDLVNAQDRQYRLWRWFSRSLMVCWLMKLTPRSWLRRLSQRVASGLQRTNLDNKRDFPEQQLRARARELPRGPATMVYGHFHVYRELSEGDKRVITLPFLGAENAGILISDKGIVRVEVAI